MANQNTKERSTTEQPFAIEFGKSGGSAPQGGYGDVSATIRSLDGFSGTAILSAVARNAAGHAASGVAVTVMPKTVRVTPDAPGHATVRIAYAHRARVGRYRFGVTATVTSVDAGVSAEVRTPISSGGEASLPNYLKKLPLAARADIDQRTEAQTVDYTAPGAEGIEVHIEEITPPTSPKATKAASKVGDHAARNPVTSAKKAVPATSGVGATVKLIDVPYIPQYAPQHCGRASQCMILATSGYAPRSQGYASWRKFQARHPLELGTVKLGDSRYEGYQKYDLEPIARSIEQGHAAIVYTDIYGGHIFVLMGYDRVHRLFYARNTFGDGKPVTSMDAFRREYSGCRVVRWLLEAVT